MDIGPQTTAIENGFNGNWWTYPPPPLNQLQHGKLYMKLKKLKIFEF